MIGKSEALLIAQEMLDAEDHEAVGFKIVEETIMETDLLWVLFFTIGDGVDSDGKEIKLRGNAPFAIEKLNGTIHRLSAGISLSMSIPELELNILTC